MSGSRFSEFVHHWGNEHGADEHSADEHSADEHSADEPSADEPSAHQHRATEHRIDLPGPDEGADRFGRAHGGSPLRAWPSGLRSVLERLNDRLPVTLQGRWRLDRRTGTVLASAVALVAVIAGGWAFFRAQSQQIGPPRVVAADHSARTARQIGPPGATRAADDTPPGTAVGGDTLPNVDSPALSASAVIVADIEGKVARPGVIRLPAGSRVLDALRAAGGALPGTDLASLNQARVLNDGEQLIVGADPSAGANGGAVPSAPARPGGHGKMPLAGPVHLNTATQEQLEQLPGVGPALAQRILDWRSEHGRFASIGELQQVRGLGGSKFAALHGLVTP